MLKQLGDITIETFLANYWQKKPLLIKNLFPGYECPLDHNDLAGLSLEDEVESRIVFEEYQGKPWQVLQGPFEADFLENLPEEKWTLLIQGLDHWAPEIADLLDQFRFIPNWRIDDIMASFAPIGGSVGPHYDQYDVFLLQAVGTRKWQVGPTCDLSTPRVNGTPLRIIKDMQVTEEWILEPGDALYLPPAYAHNGVALEHSITLSVGFRSPTQAEMLSSLADHWCEQVGSEQHLKDTTTASSANPGLISEDIIDHVKQQLLTLIQDDKQIKRWFGSFVTNPKHEGIVEPVAEDEQITPDELQELALVPEVSFRWNEGSRFSYLASEECIILSVDGTSFSVELRAIEWVKALCQSNQVDKEKLLNLTCSDKLKSLLASLFNQGSLRISREDELEDWGDDA